MTMIVPCFGFFVFFFELNNNIPPSPVVKVFAKSKEYAPISPQVPRNLFLNFAPQPQSILIK